MTQDPNLPPGCDDDDIDRSFGEDQFCANCGYRQCDCECGNFEPLNPFEYDCRYDDEGD